MKEHDTSPAPRREFKVRLTTLIINDRSYPGNRSFGDEVHVVEVRPGDLVITKDDLRAACGVLSYMLAKKLNRGDESGSLDLFEVLKAELFPEGQEASE